MSEVQSRVTENWHQLGNLYLRKFDFYEMAWMDLFDMDKSIVVPAPFGGYIAVVVDPSRLTESDKELGSVTQDKIHLYRPTGKPTDLVKWDGGLCHEFFVLCPSHPNHSTPVPLYKISGFPVGRYKWILWVTLPSSLILSVGWDHNNRDITPKGAGTTILLSISNRSIQAIS